MANPAPAFQVYAKDEYTEQAALSNEEFGAYMRGKMYAWSSGPLPLDNAKRARLLSVDQAAFPAVWAAIVHLWTETPDGWVNGPLEAQRTAHAEHRERQAENGRKGGRPAVQKNPNETQTKPTDNPPLSSGLTQTEPNTKPKPNPNESSAFCILHSAFSDLDSANYALHAAAGAQPAPEKPRQRPAPCNGTHYTTAENDAWAAETGVTLIPRGQIRKPRTGIDQSYRHRSCIGGGSWASCARGVCVPPNLARQWMDQGFDEAYCAKLTADYLEPITAGTPLESDGYRLWRGVWSAVHQPEVPRAPTAREKNTPMAVLERNWETTLTQFPSHSDMMAEALADERRKQDERNAQRLLKAGAQ